MRDELAEAFTLAVLDTSIAEVLLRAEGRTFSLGAELGEFGTTTDPATAFAIRAQTLPAHALARCADRLTVHVHGGCVGSGLEMAAWGQRVTATPQAWFQLPELAMGVLPGAGGCVALTRRIGRQRTALLVLSGKRLNARQALDWGLIDAIVDESPGNHGGADVVR
jgi:enoyl-CoA hydratase/carnithine racemase